MAESIIEKSPRGLLKVCGGPDPDVVETAGLAHDLGHPPFGHGGEAAISKAMRDSGLDEGFEGNPQSFRIVTRLAIRYSEQEPPGLDLTRASLNAILKYPWLWEKAAENDDKWGAYREDRDCFEWARDSVDVREGQRSVEAELMDWADDITYAVHDLEDFYRAGLIPLERFHAQRSYGSSDLKTPEVGRVAKVLHKEERDLTEDLTKVKEGLMSLMDPYFLPLDAPFDGRRQQREVLRAAASALITRFINAISLREPTAEDARLVEIDKEAEFDVKLLKGLTKYYVIQHPRVVSIRAGQRRMLKTLFSIYLEVIGDKKHRDRALLPKAIKDRRDGGDRPQRLAADLLASMTERQVVQTYQRLMGLATSPVSYFDI